jgi:hypothetical protein
MLVCRANAGGGDYLDKPLFHRGLVLPRDGACGMPTQIGKFYALISSASERSPKVLFDTVTYRNLEMASIT